MNTTTIEVRNHTTFSIKTIKRCVKDIRIGEHGLSEFGFINYKGQCLEVYRDEPTENWILDIQ